MNIRTLVASMALCITAGNSYAGKTMFLEVFAKSNDTKCLELNIDGVAVHSKIRLSGITFYASAVISHYNPDFLVTAYPRLGDSPLLESYAALGTAQNIVSKPIVELLSGADAPTTYGETKEWGSGKGTDSSDKQNKTLAFYETEVFGHPGNVFTWASRAFRGETVLDPGAASALITAIPTQSASIPQRVSASINEITANAGTTLGEHFSLDALRRIDPVELATNAFVGELSDLFNSSGLGQAITTASSLVPDSVQEDVVGSIINFGNGALTTLGNTAATANGGTGIPRVTGGLDSLPEFDLEGLADNVVEDIRAELGQLTPESIQARVTEEITAITDQVAEFTQMFETLTSVTDSQSLLDWVPGVSAQVMPFDGLCPSDVDPFYPYFLSGTNILSWRYKIPEIIYPQTYIPFSNSTTIGTLLPGGSVNPLASNPLSALAEIQNYGSVYPRNGYMLQSHPVKAAAVAAFRAAHVVTRPNQPHIYRFPQPRSHRDLLQLDPGYEEFSGGDDDRDTTKTYLEPDVPETGRWQLVHNEGGEEDGSCHRFGAPETNGEIADTGNPVKIIGNIANRFTEQWADDKAADDNAYMFSLWRRYRCAPRPRGSGGLFGSRVYHLFNIDFPSPIEILH